MAGGDHFNVQMTVDPGSGFVSPGSWVGFNPQPEPPGFGALGFQFQVDPASIDVIFQVMDLDTNAIMSFDVDQDVALSGPVEIDGRPVPEPATLTLLAVGGAAALRRRVRPLIANAGRIARLFA